MAQERTTDYSLVDYQPPALELKPSTDQADVRAEALARYSHQRGVYNRRKKELEVERVEMLLYAHMGGLDLATLEPRSVPEYCIGPGTGAMDSEAYVGDGGSLPKELVRRQGIVVAYSAAYGQAVDKVSQWRDGREEHHREQRPRARCTAILAFRDRMAGMDQYSDVEDAGVATPPPAVAGLSDDDFMDEENDPQTELEGAVVEPRCP
jgi:hypothetical protein